MDKKYIVFRRGFGVPVVGVTNVTINEALAYLAKEMVSSRRGFRGISGYSIYEFNGSIETK